MDVLLRSFAFARRNEATELGIFGFVRRGGIAPQKCRPQTVREGWLYNFEAYSTCSWAVAAPSLLVSG